MSTESVAATIETAAPERPGVEPLVWPAAVFVAVLVWVAAGATGEATVHAVLLGVLVVAASVDVRHRILPNRLVLPAMPIVLTAHVINDPGVLTEHLIALLATGLVLWIMAVVSRGGLGMGDVKTGALMGAGLGQLVLSALFVASLAAAVVGIVLLVRGGMSARKTAIPLGPFLAFGTFVVLLAHAVS